MKKIFRLAISVVLLLVLTYPVWSAGTTGKITGIVKDKQSGEALPGVSIRIVGTNIGASTGPDGRYSIIYVPAGRQVVEAIVIGYTSVRKEEILIVPDLTTEVNFDLTASRVELGQVTTVVAERPLIERDATSSTKIITADEIAELPIRGFQAVTQLQAGVVAGDNRQGTAIQIRGGRPGEVSYLIDGFSTQDIVTGDVGAQINNNAIAEVVVLTGGFNAEYGKAMSGVVNTVTKESAIKTTGQAEFRTDEFMGTTNGFGYNIADLSLAGPLAGKSLKYFASFEYTHQNDWNPSSGWDGRKPEDWLKENSGFAKLSYDLTPALKLKAGGSYFTEKRKEFQTLWRYNLNHLNRQERSNGMVYLTLTHNINKNTYYDLSANYFVTKSERGDDSLWRDYNNYINTVSWTDSLFGPDGRYDYRTSGWSYGDNKRQDGNNIYYLPGVSQRVYSKRQSSYYGINFDLVSQVNSYNQIKGGFETRFYTVRWFRIDLPWRANPFLDNYDKDYDIHGTISHGSPYKPTTAAVYLQDKLEFQGMVVNAGLRFDMLRAGADEFKDQLDVAEGTQKTPLDYKISPRLGIAFPVSDNTLFHFNYGHFFQPPELQYLYEGVADAINYINTGNAIIGDPGLRSEKTIAFEAGLTRSFSSTLRFDITFFSKDITNLVDTRLRTGLNRYVIYTNSDYARVRGLELALEKRKEHFISGKISYTLSEAKGTGSYEREGYYDYVTSSTGPDIVFPKTEFYLDFDQRHTISADVDIRAGEKEGVQPFRNAGLNILFTLGSGFPYTPRTPVAFNLQGLGKALGDVNSARQPWTYRIDLKADKTFNMGALNSTFYLEVINLLNTENVRTVYESSGKANTDGVIELLGITTEPYVSRYRDAVKDPDNYDVPRMVRAGLVLGF
ncbi:MAG TPA: TonB-dependent receptor [Terriglobales bacterium]|nr:TonB-dependent receptor [Terriglobales bacterium]